MGSSIQLQIQNSCFKNILVNMSTKTIEGDWEFVSDKGYDPVKISIKNLSGSDWIVACMIPKGNMMTSVLKRQDGDSYSLQQFVCSNKKETPVENKDLEADFKTFLEKGICMISRTEDSLTVKAGDEARTLNLDDMLKRQEDAKRAAMTAANKTTRRR